MPNFFSPYDPYKVEWLNLNWWLKADFCALVEICRDALQWGIAHRAWRQQGVIPWMNEAKGLLLEGVLWSICYLLQCALCWSGKVCQKVQVGGKEYWDKLWTKDTITKTDENTGLGGDADDKDITDEPTFYTPPSSPARTPSPRPRFVFRRMVSDRNLASSNRAQTASPPEPSSPQTPPSASNSCIQLAPAIKAAFKAETEKRVGFKAQEEEMDLFEALKL